MQRRGCSEEILLIGSTGMEAIGPLGQTEVRCGADHWLRKNIRAVFQEFMEPGGAWVWAPFEGEAKNPGEPGRGRNADRWAWG